MIETNGKDGPLDGLLNFWLNLFSDAVQPSDKMMDGLDGVQMTETNTDDFFQMVKNRLDDWNK